MGFDVAATQSHSSRTDSFGLQAMRERLHQLGGSLEVWSAPGRGTTITARLDPDTDHEGARP
ncbi:Signal transduction histidine kinase, nitrate /nitrite-specific [Mycobacteroides abscessus subsp. abscessus]|nr:Signal transduction histidine kinase, nitrate /nitrite-specific [Mycobacteroides abscessus subsp. abscessus]